MFPPPTAFTSLCCWAKPGEEKLLLPKGGWQENCWTPPMAVASTWLLSPLKAVNFVCRVFLIFHSVAAAVGTTSEGWEQHKHSPPWEHCLFPFCRSQIPQLSPHLVPPTVHLWFFLPAVSHENRTCPPPQGVLITKLLAHSAGISFSPAVYSKVHLHHCQPNSRCHPEFPGIGLNLRFHLSSWMMVFIEPRSSLK